MCGIFCEILCQHVAQDPSDTWEELKPLLKNRGPDFQVVSPLEVLQGSLRLRFGGSVLWLRGDHICQQPRTGAGNVFLWNGDVFDGMDIPQHECDTQTLFDELQRAKCDSEVIDVFAGIRGPHAFVYYCQSLNQLYFGRDFFGRHCLLVSRSKEKITMTSVAKNSFPNFKELPALGIFRMDLKTLAWHLHPWSSADASQLHQDFPFVNVLGDSGLIKSVILPQIECHSRFDENPEICDEEGDEMMKAFLALDGFKNNLNELHRLLKQAVKTRVEKQPNFCKECIKTLNRNCDHPKVGLLFSGGLDSVVLTKLVDEVLDSNECIELINVAFEQHNGSFEVPDRLTCHQALEELEKLSPGRAYKLIEVNVTKNQLIKARSEHIKDLLYPLETVLDDSIGCALWFAANGSGCDTTSSARVLLLGMGADEQLGGYSRHRAKFNQGGLDALSEEIHMEVSRISHRNLGRDNRIIADRGVAPRYPYLDENVVEFLSSLEVKQKMDLRLRRGIGEKILLRALAFQMGLKKTSLEPKRAIQFGSRIAKMENKKEKGSDLARRNP